jgi:5-methylcytosine-specific restriction enzyme A
MPRTEFSRKVRSAAYERANGHCEKCTAELRPGKYHYDHDLPDALGGEPTLENCRVLCTNCHGEKTAKVDVPTIAKSNRVRDRHRGAKKRQTRGFATNRDGPFKAKIGGGIQRRGTP